MTVALMLEASIPEFVEVGGDDSVGWRLLVEPNSLADFREWLDEMREAASLIAVVPEAT